MLTTKTFAVADMLEANLAPVNASGALRPASLKPNLQAGKGARLEQTEGRVMKNHREKTRRDGERQQLQRMGRLFRVGPSLHGWTRADILGFGKIFSIPPTPRLEWSTHMVRSSRRFRSVRFRRLLARFCLGAGCLEGGPKMESRSKRT